MHIKIHMHWLKDLVRSIRIETCFWKKHPPGAWKDKLPLYNFGYANIFRTQKVFKPITTGKVEMKIWFLSQMSQKMIFKFNVAKNVNKTILAIFKSFKQPLDTRLSKQHNKQVKWIHKKVNFTLFSASHSIFLSSVTSLISVCFAVKKNFFNRYIEKLLKSKNDWLLIYHLLHYC